MSIICPSQSPAEIGLLPIVVKIDTQRQTVSIWRDREAAMTEYDEPTAWVWWGSDEDPRDRPPPANPKQKHPC